MRTLLAAAALASLLACGPPAGPAGPAAPPGAFGGPPPSAAGGSGTTRQSAIEVCEVRGEYEYLARLRCPDGNTPTYDRDGSVGQRDDIGPNDPQLSFEDAMNPNRRLGPGEKDPHIVDLYSVVCSDGRHEVYLDMYHCAQPGPSTAPPGFTLAR